MAIAVTVATQPKIVNHDRSPAVFVIAVSQKLIRLPPLSDTERAMGIMPQLSGQSLPHR